MMKRITAVIIGFFFCMIIFSQTKHTFWVGHGSENAYNGMITSYNLSGSKIINLSYGNEKILKKEWKSFFDIGMGVSSLRLDYDFANKLRSGQPYVLGFDAFLSKSILKKVIERDKFNVHAGFITSAQGIYQVTEYTTIPANGGNSIDFFQIGISEGISASTQVNIGKIIIQNTTSCLMAGALLYPNYTSDSQFINFTGDYLIFTFINKRIFVENRLKMEVPIYIKGKFMNSFSIMHDFKYEYSYIKDNFFRRFGHTINIGLLFKLDKLNIYTL